MLSSTPPIRPHPKEEAVSNKEKKLRPPPSDDRFRKSMRDRPSAQGEKEPVSAMEDDQEPPSLFDLSKSSKRKTPSSLSSKSTLKDSNADPIPYRPLTDEQSQGEELPSFASAEEGTMTEDDFPQPPIDNHLAVATDDEWPIFEEPLQDSETPQPHSPLQPPKPRLQPSHRPQVQPRVQAEPEPQVQAQPQLPTQPRAQPHPQAGRQPLAQATPQPQLQPQPPSPTPVQPQPQPQQVQPDTAEALKRGQAVAALKGSQKVKGSDEEFSGETNQLGAPSKKEKSKKSETSSFDGEARVKEEAAGALNVGVQSVAFQSEKIQGKEEVPSPATTREIANQIIDRIQIMRKDNETQTMITLRHPPVLAGATVTLTASDHAKREFNISFANLSPDAKLMLDRRFKEDSLTEALERKGIIVHVLTTSTQAENLLTADAGQASRDRQEQQQQQQEQQQQKKRHFPGVEEEEIT